jgi:hypothetical protein
VAVQVIEHVCKALAVPVVELQIVWQPPTVFRAYDSIFWWLTIFTRLL